MKSLLVLALLMSASAFGRAYDYDCYSFYWNGSDSGKGTMELSVNARKATADIHSESWDNLGGLIDSSYRSRGERTFVKYGSELIVEKSLLTGGRRLRDGSWGGIARVEGEAEGGFFQYKFYCKLR